MASIEVKSRNNGKVYYIVQAIRDENGKRVQKRIRCKSLQEAQALLPDVERANAQNQLYQHPRTVSSFIDLTPVVDMTITVRQLLEEYIEQQARDGVWSSSTYHSRMTQARTYIYPHIGDVPVHMLTARALKQYYDKMLDQPAPYIIVKQTLGRHNRESIKRSKTKVLFEFPMLDASQNTALMLKEPKTKKSTRKVYIPVTLSQELREYERSHKETLRLCGVYDFNMVFIPIPHQPIENLDGYRSVTLRQQTLPYIQYGWRFTSLIDETLSANLFNRTMRDWYQSGQRLSD